MTDIHELYKSIKSHSDNIRTMRDSDSDVTATMAEVGKLNKLLDDALCSDDLLDLDKYELVHVIALASSHRPMAPHSILVQIAIKFNRYRQNQEKGEDLFGEKSFWDYTHDFSRLRTGMKLHARNGEEFVIDRIGLDECGRTAYYSNGKLITIQYPTAHNMLTKFPYFAYEKVTKPHHSFLGEDVEFKVADTPASHHLGGNVKSKSV